jgi:heat-inducible transcriptional repressor
VVAVLTERQKYILTVVIDDFIQCAEPIGSRSVSKHSDMNCSPATIRNDMADLEALGYLEQPHPSSGRIPSQKGYRYYVDHLLRPHAVGLAELGTVRAFFSDRIAEVEQLVQQAVTVLSELTQYTAFVLGPDTIRHTLASLQWLPVDDHIAVALLVTNMGHVESRRIRLPAAVDALQLESLVRMMSNELRGVPMHELGATMLSLLRTHWHHHVHDNMELIALIDALCPQGGCADRVYWGGATHLLRHNEFQDVSKCKELLAVLEQAQAWKQFLSDVPQGLHVTIGAESACQAMHGCSMITSSYAAGEHVYGTIGILGPTRMDYRRAMAVLRLFAAALSKHFADESWE